MQGFVRQENHGQTWLDKDAVSQSSEGNNAQGISYSLSTKKMVELHEMARESGIQ